MITLIKEACYSIDESSLISDGIVIGWIHRVKKIPFALFKLDQPLDRKKFPELRECIGNQGFHIGSGRELMLAAKEHPDIFSHMAPTPLGLGERYEPILYRYHILSGDAETVPGDLREGELFFAVRN